MKVYPLIVGVHMYL